VSPLRAFTTITLPLLRGSITAASVVVGLFSFTSYGVVRVLGGPARSTIETEIYTRAVLIGDLPGALALSIGQMLVLSVAVAWWMRSNRRTNQMVLSAPHRTVAQRGRQRIVLNAIVLFTTCVVLAPMVALAWRSLRTANTFSLAGWNAVFSSATTGALQTSASFAIVTAIIATAFGLLVSFAVAYGSRRYAVLELVSALPLTVSAVTIGLGMLITFDVSPIDFRSAWLITPIAHSLIALPLVVRTTLPVVRAVPVGLREVAATMGANRWHRFRSIDWPLTQRAAATAGALSFAVSLGEFGATSFITRRTSETLPVLISRLLSRTGDTVQAHAYALSTIFVISSIIGIYIADTMRKQQVSR
jgi:thiamine transport system permease protein